jgi:hypothetical protein
VGAWTGVGNTNSTLNMVPGGLLAQNIGGVATHGRSNAEMNRFLPDPKKAAIKGLMGAVRNPNSTLSDARSFSSTVASARPSIGAVFSNAGISSPSHTLQMVQRVATAPKPSILSGLMPASVAMPFSKKSTLFSESDSSLSEEGTQEKMGILEAMLTPETNSTPRPPPMTTLGNENLQRAVETSAPVLSPSDMSASSMLPFVALACVVVLVVMR